MEHVRTPIGERMGLKKSKQSERPETNRRCARLAFFWSVLGSAGVLLALPYTLAVNPAVVEQSPLPLPTLVAAQVVQMGLTLFLGGWLALKAGQAIGLDSPIARAWVYKAERRGFEPDRVVKAAAGGLALGFLLLVLDRWVFLPRLPQVDAAAASVTRWQALLASFYGGITEELLLRLIFMTLIAWLLVRLLAKAELVPIEMLFSTAIVASAILFAIGHLPAAAAVWGLTPAVVIRVVLLNVAAGVPFGFLYWRWGLEYAMIAHFAADIALHVVGGA